MTNASQKGVLPTKFTPITKRELSNLDADIAAVAALGQGATNVEMFTIPLYLCSMSSLQGTHEINSKGTGYYKGRTWPGMSTAARLNLTTNQQAYNTIFSVFIQEMLHLQLAANLTVVLGVTPKFFDGTLLENTENGWSCYGKDNSVIPHIIDLKDTVNTAMVKVTLDELNSEQIKLFMAIEQPHDLALKNIKPEALAKYFPSIPFANWTAKNTEADLPMFGTIGWMYYCLLSYLSMEYSDGQNLWEKMFKPADISKQRDLFNEQSTNHAPEYPKMPGKIMSQAVRTAGVEAIKIVAGICDQGEGGIGKLIGEITNHFKIRNSSSALNAETNYVQAQFQPDSLALQQDYPSYDANGEATGGSSDGYARTAGDSFDHWARFSSLNELIKLPDFLTWSQWFAAGKRWEVSNLTNADYDPATAPKNIPSPQDVAKALNELKTSSKAELSKVAVGAIEGINRVLTQSWGDPKISFPYPSMAGSGDRMSFYWAVFGEAPDFSKGIGKPDNDVLYHACQAMDYQKPGSTCAAMEVYHTCRGSNSCKAQGGCGFVQSTQGGGGCGAMRVSDVKLHAGNLCGNPSTGKKYTAPNDNICGAFGGCAVPISASQLYPETGTMVLENVTVEPSVAFGEMPFKLGDSVYDIAWDAYSTVMKKNQKDPGDKPKPTALRIALPPST